jgi:uncharacterized protein YoxC
VTDPLTWGAIIAASGALVAVAKFWIDMGKAHQTAEEAKKVADAVERDAKARADLLSAKIDMLASNINEYKVVVAQTYATAKALSEAEQSLGRSLESATQGIYQRLDTMNTRLDNVITMAKDHH